MSSTNYVSFVDDDSFHNKSNSSSHSGNYYKFLTDLYWYYEHGGFLNILIFRITTILSAVFTLSFIFVLSTMVRWNLAFEKHIDPSMTLLMYPTMKAGIWWAILGSLTFVVSVATSVSPIVTAWRMKKYTNDVMMLDDDEVDSMPWDVFVRYIADRDPRILNYNGTTWQHIVMIITRKKNYMVGLYNQRLINVSVPWFPSWRSVTTVFEWSFDYATSDLWTELGEVNPDYISGDYQSSVHKLRRAFVRTGILGLVASPLVLVAMILYAFFAFLDQVRNSPGVLFSRTWSTLAKWRMRCIDEVDCCLADRLASAYPDARDYTRQFKNRVSITVARFLVYALAVLIAPLAIFSLIAEDVLEINMWGEPWPRKVIFVFTIVAALLAMAREMVPGDDFVPQPQKHMADLLKHVRLPMLPVQRHKTLDLQYEWVRDAHCPFIRDRFAGYFKSKGLIFLSELTAVITVPFIFMYSMYDEAGEIIQFLRDNTVPMGPGLGTKFIHSGLDSIDKLPPSRSPTTTLANSAPGATTVTLGNAGRNAIRASSASTSILGHKSHSLPVDKDTLFRSKVEESIVAFKGFYPHWLPHSAASNDLLGSSDVEHYGSTAYRPSPNQIIDANMISYLGRHNGDRASYLPTTVKRASYYPQRASTVPLSSQMDLDEDSDAGNNSEAMVNLDPILDDSKPTSSRKGDDLV